MQILVVVAQTQVNFIFTLILSLEEEKGFIRTVFGYELVGPKSQVNSVNTCYFKIFLK